MEVINDVSSPMFICDTFTERRLRGNPCAVCFCPTSVYNSGWSEICSLEASCGRGEPMAVQHCLSKEEQEKKDTAYAEARDQIMGEAFQHVAAEMQLSETCFVYRLPAARIRTIKEAIKMKLQEFDQEHAEKKRLEEEKMEAELLKQSNNWDPSASNGGAMEGSPRTVFSGGLIPSASFLGCLENSMSMGAGGSINALRRTAAKKMQVQWFGLRWFTPKGESFMCGHGTLAAAHCLFECSRLARQESTKRMMENVPGEFFLPLKTDVICFVTDLGIVTVRKHEVQEAAGTALANRALGTERSLNASLNPDPAARFGSSSTAATRMEPYRVRDPMDPAHLIRDAYEVHFPSNEPQSVLEHLPAGFTEELLRAFSFPVHSAAGDEAVVVEDIALAPKMSIYLVRIKNVHHVIEAQPNEVALRNVFLSKGFTDAVKAHPRVMREPKGIIITAQNPINNKHFFANHNVEMNEKNCLLSGRGSDGQVISRFFEPWQGVLEDPVSGSAHTILAPYWLKILNNTNNYNVGDKIICYQASSRGGYVPCIIIGKEADRVALQGCSVTTLRGTITYELHE